MLDAVRDREAELTRWVRENAPECFEEQKHLGVGSPERAYWHHGYLMAVRDMLKLLSTPEKLN